MSKTEDKSIIKEEFVPVVKKKTEEVKQIEELWKIHKNVIKIRELTNRPNNFIIMKIREIILKDFIVLLKSGHSPTQISKIIGINTDCLSSWIKKYDLAEFKINGFKKSTVTSKELVFGYIKMNGLHKLAKQYKAGLNTIRNKIIKEGLIIDLKYINPSKVKKHIKNRFSYPLNEKTYDFILGGLLGDAGISSNSVDGSKSVAELPYNLQFNVSEYIEAHKNLKSLQEINFEEFERKYKNSINLFNESAVVISHYPTGIFRYYTHIKEKNWVNFIADMIETTGLYVRRRIAKGRKSNMYSYEFLSSDAWYIESGASIELAELYYEWYSGERHKKIIPKSFTHISPNCLLAWYVGDGSCDTNSIEIYTNNFTESESKYLATLFDKIRIPCIVRKKYHKKADKYYYSLRFRKGVINKFLRYINRADPEALKIAKGTVPWKFDPDLRYNDIKDLRNIYE